MTNIDTTLLSDINAQGQDNKTKKKNEIDQEGFMKLFLTQLKLQDPMKPTSNTEMMQQMAQMTSLSSSQELEKTINSLSSNLGSSQVLQASQLIGHSVQLPSKVAELSDTKGLNGSVIMPTASNNIVVSITDPNNQVVKTINLNAGSSGVVDFHWDGLDADGNKLNPNFYTISASAAIDGKQVAVPTAGTFSVNSVAMDQKDNSVILNLSGMGGVKMNDIIKIV